MMMPAGLELVRGAMVGQTVTHAHDLETVVAVGLTGEAARMVG